MRSLDAEQFPALFKSAAQGVGRLGRVEDAFGEKALVVNRKADDLGRFDGLPRRLAGRGDDEIRQRPPFDFSGAFQHRVDMDGQAGFKTGGL